MIHILGFLLYESQRGFVFKSYLMFGSCTEATPRDENCRVKLMLKLILLHTLHVLSKFVISSGDAQCHLKGSDNSFLISCSLRWIKII